MVPYEASMDNERMFLLFSLSFLMIFSNSIFLQYENLEQLCNDPRVRAAVLTEMDAVGMEAQVILKINYLASIVVLSFEASVITAVERFRICKSCNFSA